LIAIDEYAGDMPSLDGAVGDMSLVKDFLMSDLEVPQSHIKVLKNDQATRKAILDSIKALTNNPEIKHGEPILIYFAGHGCLVGEMQAIVPFDAPMVGGELKNLISDIKLASLLRKLADKKGDNVVRLLILITISCFEHPIFRPLSSTAAIRLPVHGVEMTAIRSAVSRSQITFP
jgi:hypothetical protein